MATEIPYPAPAGCMWEPRPSDNSWRPTSTWTRMSHCRWGAGGGKTSCRATPCVLEIKRGPQWWAYCAEHTYGHWVEDGIVWHWRLAEVADA